MFYFSSWHLLAQSRQRKHQINVRNLFNIFTKDTWRTSVAFTHYSGVSIVDFEKANAGWHCLKSDHQIRTRKNSVFRHFTQCEYLVCSLLMVFYFLYKLIVLAFSMFAQVISFVQITWALTHYNSVLLTYIPWKHQKTFRFFDVFRGNR